MSGPWEKYQQAPPENAGPWDKYKAVPIKPTEVESGLRGAASGATFGFNDELVGGAKGLVGSLQGEGKFSDLYEKYRDEQRKKDAEAAAENPKSYFAGNLVGTGAGLLVPGLDVLAPAKGAGMAANVARGVAGGALVGAGTSENNPLKNSDQLSGFTKDVGLGGALGGATGAAGEVIGNTAKAILPENLEEWAAQRGFKAATGQNKKIIKQNFLTDQIEDKGKALLSKDEAGPAVIGRFDRTEDIGPKAEAKRQFFGDKINEVGKKIDEIAPNSVSGKQISDDILNYASNIGEHPGNEGIIQNLMKQAQFYENKGDIGFKEAQALKNEYKFDPTNTTSQTLTKDSNNAIKGIVGDAMDNSAQTLADSANKEGNKDLSNLLSKYGDMKQKYGAYATASQAATDRAAGNLSSRLPSPSDYATGIGGGLIAAGSHPGVIGPAAIAVVAGAAHKLARERGSAFAARTAMDIASLMEKSPEFAGKWGRVLVDAANQSPLALTTAHEALMTQDPEYKKAVMNAGAQP